MLHTATLLCLFAPSLAQNPLPISYYIGIGHNSLTDEFMLNVLNVTFDTKQNGPMQHG